MSGCYWRASIHLPLRQFTLDDAAETFRLLSNASCHIPEAAPQGRSCIAWAHCVLHVDGSGAASTGPMRRFVAGSVNSGGSVDNAHQGKTQARLFAGGDAHDTILPVP